jgi:hypothetical protein
MLPGMISGARAYRLLTYVLAEIEPHLPTGVHIKVTPDDRWTTLQRADDGSIDLGPLVMGSDDRGLPKASSGIGVRALGPLIPFLPRKLQTRLAARHAVETLLDLAYQDLDSHSDRVPDMSVHAATTATGVAVSYIPPDRPNERVELESIPFDLL